MNKNKKPKGLTAEILKNTYPTYAADVTPKPQVEFTLTDAGIATLSKMGELAELALPLIKYLRENHNPHATIVITQNNAEVLHGVLSTGYIH